MNRGLMMRGGQPPPANLEGVVHGYVVYLSWRSVQPNGPNDFATKYIDGMIGAVRAWNAAHPGNQPQGLRVRVFAGVYSPAWVLAMSGGPVTVSGRNGQHGTVPRWWTQPVVDAYTAFIAKLAAHIDSVPEVREVTVGLTMEFYGEIFQRYDMPALQAAGFTEALDIAAIQASFRAHAAFRHTTTQVDVDGYPVWSQYAITAQLMGYARSVLASVQFANAALKEINGGPLYTLMQSFGPRGKSGGPTCHLTFQTLPVVGNITTVIARAISYGATSVELPADLGSASVLAPLDVALQGNG